MRFENTKYQIPNTNKGISLVEVIVGIALIGIVFVATNGVLRTSLQAISASKLKTGAVALANERLEYMRSLAYDDVGTQGGIPAGLIPQEEIIELNNVDYTVRTFVQYIDDDADGEGSNDANAITTDYKFAKVTVSWISRGEPYEITSSTKIVPKGIESASGGGTLKITVLDEATSLPLSGAQVDIYNEAPDPDIDVTTYSNTAGEVYFPGTPEATGYEITISKSGYTTTQTYGTSEIANPVNRHANVFENTVTSLTFIIGEVAQKTIGTFSPPQDVTWEQDFSTDSSLAYSSNTAVSGGSLSLALDGSTGQYYSSGEATANQVTASEVATWGELTWSDDTQGDSNVTYQIYYDTGSGLALVPDSQLLGNSTGFTSSPVDLSSVSAELYQDIRVGATLSASSDGSITPDIFSWSITLTEAKTPLPNAELTMRGEKLLGTDGAGDPVYQYSETLTTDATGELTETELPADTYHLSASSASGLAISQSCPEAQPRSIAPASTNQTEVVLVSATSDSLIVSVTDSTGVPVSDASVSLTRTGYSEEQETSECGQVYFEGLGTYNDYQVEVTKSGFITNTVSDITVDGYSQEYIQLMSS